MKNISVHALNFAKTQMDTEIAEAVQTAIDRYRAATGFSVRTVEVTLLTHYDAGQIDYAMVAGASTTTNAGEFI